jgi:hypothetical protein
MAAFHQQLTTDRLFLKIRNFFRLTADGSLPADGFFCLRVTIHSSRSKLLADGFFADRFKE